MGGVAVSCGPEGLSVEAQVNSYAEAVEAIAEEFAEEHRKVGRRTDQLRYHYFGTFTSRFCLLPPLQKPNYLLHKDAVSKAVGVRLSESLKARELTRYQYITEAKKEQLQRQISRQGPTCVVVATLIVIN